MRREDPVPAVDVVDLERRVGALADSAERAAAAGGEDAEERFPERLRSVGFGEGFKIRHPGLRPCSDF